MDNGVGSAPADVGTIESPTRPVENILSYYYGNYITGYNLGLETIIKYKPLSKLLIEISHNYFQYFIEYKKNEDFDINALTASQRDLVDEEYPLLPKNTFRAKIYYDVFDHLRFSLSTTYSTAFFSRYSNIYSTYQYEQQRFDPLYADGGNQTLIGGKFDNRFILSFKIEKSFLEDKLCLYLFGYDITSSPFVEGINQLNNAYPRQVGGMYGMGLSYSIP
jgi:outer membrane receptor for Fe3+-dicitrate